MRDYGVQLLKRLLTGTSQIHDLVLIGGLLRQSVGAFDGWILCSEAGAVQASKAHARTLFEASLYYRLDSEEGGRALGEAIVRLQYQTVPT